MPSSISVSCISFVFVIVCGLCVFVCVVVIGEIYAMRYKKYPKSKPIKMQSGSSIKRYIFDWFFISGNVSKVNDR